jgi:hypothetical protein
MLSLSSCLKDNTHGIDLGSSAPVTYFNLGGQSFFGPDAFTDPVDTITRQFAVTVASKTPPATETKITLALDNTIIDKYNATSTLVQYLPFPADAFSFTQTSVTIPAGQTTAIVSVTIYKNKLDPTLSYMLPIKIANSPYTISGNMGIHYFHVIGNDFSGNYNHDFIRTPHGGDFTGETATFFPDSPTQFEVAGGYYSGTVRYVVSYTEVGKYPNATYSNLQIAINSDDVSNILGTAPGGGINVTVPPSIVGYTPGQTYTYAQMLTLFQNGFTYGVLGSSGARTNLDQYTKQ